MKWRQFMPPAFVASLIFAAMASPFFAPARIVLAGIIAAYVAGNLVASLAVALRYRARQAVILPVVFATLHLGYGLGFLAGLIHFAGSWRDHGSYPQMAANRG